MFLTQPAIRFFTINAQAAAEETISAGAVLSLQRFLQGLSLALSGHALDAPKAQFCAGGLSTPLLWTMPLLFYLYMWLLCTIISSFVACSRCRRPKGVELGIDGAQSPEQKELAQSLLDASVTDSFALTEPHHTSPSATWHGQLEVKDITSETPKLVSIRWLRASLFHLINFSFLLFPVFIVSIIRGFLTGKELPSNPFRWVFIGMNGSSCLYIP